MKKCVIIVCFANNQYRKELLQRQVNFFNDLDIDTILVSSDHIDKIDGAKNYITIKHTCETKYITEWMHPHVVIDDKKYYKYDAYKNIQAKTFFIKLFQCSFNYCKNLGYDFSYLLDFDNIINKDYIQTAFNDSLDLSKVYFHNFGKSEEYQGAFFYGNLDVLIEMFAEKNLEKLRLFGEDNPIYTNEGALCFLASIQKSKLVLLSSTPEEVYSIRNLFSSSNIADFYYNSRDKEYYFLQFKGDTCENEFACELFLENVLIHSSHETRVGCWNLHKLENNRNYKIKYYDAAISELTLSKTLNIYTDTNTVTTSNWIERT
jgi:hypothetical protein